MHLDTLVRVECRKMDELRCTEVHDPKVVYASYQSLSKNVILNTTAAVRYTRFAQRGLNVGESSLLIHFGNYDSSHN